MDVEFKNQALPQEVLDQLVDGIGQDYIGSFFYGCGDALSQMTLVSFLSVSRSFHDRAIAPLFREVQLPDGKEENVLKRISGLRQIMKPVPGSTLRTVVSCIQIFTLSLNGFRSSAVFDPLEPQPEDEGHKWLVDILSNEETSALFDDLHQDGSGIRALTICLTTARNVKWTDLTLRCSSSMLSLIRSPHLKSLHISKISRIPPNLLHGSHIRDLRLEQLDFGDLYHPMASNHEYQLEDPEGYELPCPKLETFHTDNDFPINLDPAMSPLINLKKVMTYSLFPKHYILTQKILQLARNTLEDINLHFSGDIRIPAESIDFGRMPRLQILALHHFRSFASPYQALDDPGMAHICHMLDARTPLNSLTELNLDLHFNEVGVQENFLHPQPNSHWQDIDAILTSAKYPALRRVSVKIDSDIILEDPGAVFNKKQHIQDTHQLFCFFSVVCVR